MHACTHHSQRARIRCSSTFHSRHLGSSTLVSLFSSLTASVGRRDSMKASKRKRLRSDRTSGAAPPVAQCRSLPVPLPACTPLVHSPVGSRSSFYGHFLFIQCHFPCSRLGRAPPCRALAHCGCSQYRRQHPETEPHVDEAEPAASTALPLGRENSRRSSVIDEVLHRCNICTGTALTAATSAL